LGRAGLIKKNLVEHPFLRASFDEELVCFPPLILEWKSEVGYEMKFNDDVVNI